MRGWDRHQAVSQPTQIADRLWIVFGLLRGCSRGSHWPRHQTLRALVDWSPDLAQGGAGEGGACYLRRRRVFAGSWTASTRRRGRVRRGDEGSLMARILEIASPEIWRRGPLVLKNRNGNTGTSRGIAFWGDGFAGVFTRPRGVHEARASGGRCWFASSICAWHSRNSPKQCRAAKNLISGAAAREGTGLRGVASNR